MSNRYVWGKYQISYQEDTETLNGTYDRAISGNPDIQFTSAYYLMSTNINRDANNGQYTLVSPSDVKIPEASFYNFSGRYFMFNGYRQSNGNESIQNKDGKSSLVLYGGRISVESVQTETSSRLEITYSNVTQYQYKKNRSNIGYVSSSSSALMYQSRWRGS